MTTFRKLPMIAPRTPVVIKTKGRGRVSIIEVSIDEAENDSESSHRHCIWSSATCQRFVTKRRVMIEIGASFSSGTFVLHFPKQQLLQERMMSGKARDAPAG